MQTGDNVLISGVIITGTEPKKIMFRAVGNSMNVNGVPVQGRLVDPTLTLHDSEGDEIGFNDNWGEAPEPERTEIENTPLKPQDPQEAALLRTLTPGPYTAIVRGKGGTTGIALAEAFDLAMEVDGRLANVSTRGFVDTKDSILIGGAIVGGGGGGGVRVVIRAIGPSLQIDDIPIPGRMADPKIELFNENGMSIAANDDWRKGQREEIEKTGLAPENELEAALIVTLPPGRTTAHLRGNNDATGIALIEIYKLPEAENGSAQ